MQPMTPDLEDQPSLQRGLGLYANYCLGCHALGFQRYERTADDLGIPHDVALNELVFTGQKIGELMTTAMDPESAKAWFGAPPPDLTMVARVRSPEWILQLPKNLLHRRIEALRSEQQGFLRMWGMAPCAHRPARGAAGKPALRGTVDCRELVVEAGSGLLTPEQYDQAAYDLANFLHYVGEPMRLERQRLGIYVLIFLAVFGVFTYLLNREFWKDVH